MGQAVIGDTDLRWQDICSSVLPTRVQNLRLSMTVSLAAHVGLAVTLLFVFVPDMEAVPARGPDAFEIALVSPSVMAALERPTQEAHDKVTPPIETPPAPMPEAAERPLEMPKPMTPMAPVVQASVSKPKVVKREAHMAEPQRTLSAQSPAAPSPAAPVQEASHASAGGEMARDADLHLVTKPRFRTPPRPPVYPKRARDLGQEGEALVRVRLDDEGNADEVLIWKSSGFALLDHAALVAVRRWQFEPERRNGMPTIAWVQIPVHFSLN